MKPGVLIISCPRCGRSGNLPERFRAGEHQVRCRRCKAKFSTRHLSPQDAATRWGEDSSEFSLNHALDDSGEWRYGDDDSGLIESGSADSHYELSVVDTNEALVLPNAGADATEAAPASTYWGLDLLHRLKRFESLWMRVMLPASFVLGTTAILAGCLLLVRLAFADLPPGAGWLACLAGLGIAALGMLLGTVATLSLRLARIAGDVQRIAGDLARR